MKRIIVLLVCLLMGLAFPLFSEDVKGGLSESNIWEIVPCDLDSDEYPTTIVEDGTVLYVGTVDSTAPYQASVWAWDGTSCTRIGDTNQYYIYSSVVYNTTSIYFGTRNHPTGVSGAIYEYNTTTTTFGALATTTWWNIAAPHDTPGWVETMYVWDGRMFLGGTYNLAGAPWSNVFWIKYCATAPCSNAGDWAWTVNTDVNLGQIDDVLAITEYDDNLYASTYDWASVLRYYNNNDTWWYSLNETGYGYVDGVPYTTASHGIYNLVVLDDCLHVVGTYAWGLNWTMCGTGGTWESGNITQNSQVARGIIFNDEIYYGTLNSSGYQRIGTFNNITHNQVFQDDYPNDFFLYFAEFNSELYVTNENNLYVRTESAPRIRITSPQNNQSIYGFWRLNAKVDTDKSVTHVIFRLADYDDWFTATWDHVLGIYYYEYLRTDRYPDGTYYLEGYLNHTDGTYSVDNITFVIDNDRYEWIVEDDDGILKRTYNLPWVPPVDFLNGPDYMEGITYLDPYYVFTYTCIKSSSSAAASHTSYNPYDITESDVEILEDILWLSEVTDTLNIWINDTKSTSGTGDDTNLVNDAGVTSYELSGQNITIEADTTAFSFIRRARIRLVNSFLWGEYPDGSYGASVTFYNNMSVDFTNVVFFVGAAEKGGLIIPIDVMEATVWDQTNGMSLHNGQSFTVTSGGFWLAISTLSAGTDRTFVFNYYALKETITTQLILSPYVCDTNSPYDDKPIRCVVNHDQPNDEDFQGTVIFELSEISQWGKINWNRVLMRTQADNQLYLKGSHWYSSGSYQITMPNQEFEAGESLTFEIFIGTVERSPDTFIDAFRGWGWIIGGIVFGICLFWFTKGLNEGDRSEARKTAWKIRAMWLRHRWPASASSRSQKGR